MLRSLATPLLAAAVLLVSTMHCGRSSAERRRAEAESLAREEAQRQAAYVPPPLPRDPPLEKVRVPDSGLPCDVDDVLARKCRRCHTTPARHNAPFELYTWDDTRKVRLDKPLYVDIGRVVDSGYMPLGIEADPPVERLTPEEKKSLLDWVDAGAPKTSCPPDDAGARRTRTPPDPR